MPVITKVSPEEAAELPPVRALVVPLPEMAYRFPESVDTVPLPEITLAPSKEER